MGDLYTITKIWKSEETKDTATFEDKFRITVDKNVNWDASEVADPDGDGDKNTGYVRSSSSRRRRRARSPTCRSARTAASATATTRSASASRATPTTTATRSRRSRSKLADQARGIFARRSAGGLRSAECAARSSRITHAVVIGK